MWPASSILPNLPTVSINKSVSPADNSNAANLFANSRCAGCNKLTFKVQAQVREGAIQHRIARCGCVGMSVARDGALAGLPEDLTWFLVQRNQCSRSSPQLAWPSSWP